MDLRKIIADQMERRGVTQLELSALTSITQPRISDFLTGKREVNSETLRKMLEALELEIRPTRRRRKG